MLQLHQFNTDVKMVVSEVPVLYFRCQNVLSEFLTGIKKSKSCVNFAGMANILIVHSQNSGNMILLYIKEHNIRGCTDENSKITFLISQGKHMLLPSLEPFWQDGSNEGSQHRFIWRNKENYP